MKGFESIYSDPRSPSPHPTAPLASGRDAADSELGSRCKLPIGETDCRTGPACRAYGLERDGARSCGPTGT